MTRWARVGVGMIALCAAVSPFGSSIAHEKDTPGLENSIILQLWSKIWISVEFTENEPFFMKIKILRKMAVSFLDAAV